MPQRLRVFISSTMEDLQNERHAVRQCLLDLGFEPLLAETFSPTGDSIWSVIESEIRSSQIFILIIGSNYGFSPKSDADSDLAKSITHLEYDLARQLNLPILPFFKRINHGAPMDEKCSAFRREVSDWGAGLLRAEFDLAVDLAEKVGRAVSSIDRKTPLTAEAKRQPNRNDSQKTPRQNSSAKSTMHEGLQTRGSSNSHILHSETNTSCKADSSPLPWLRIADQTSIWRAALEHERKWLFNAISLIHTRYPSARLYAATKNKKDTILIIGPSTKIGRRLVIRLGDKDLGPVGQIHLRVAMSQWQKINSPNRDSLWIDPVKAPSTHEIAQWLDALPPIATEGLT